MRLKEAMTAKELAAKKQLYKLLAENGFRSYGRLFWNFDLHLTKDPNTIAFLNMKDGSITVNEGLKAYQLSTILRHEILHQFLKHEKRLLRHLAIKNGCDPEDAESNVTLKKLIYANQLFNVAADYEISNKGYLDEDKEIARAIELNGKTLQGLVTEDKHPEWVDLSLEDMYDKLIEEAKNNPPPEPPPNPMSPKKVFGKFVDSNTFLDRDGNPIVFD